MRVRSRIVDMPTLVGRLLLSLLGLVLLGLFQHASAETVLFEARVQLHDPRPKPCPNGVYICGTAQITGFGSAEYLFVLTTLHPQPGACISPSGTSTGGAYAATVTFTLVDGSILTVNEEGVVCGPGVSLLAPSSYRAYGNPVDGSGKWVVQSASGQFAALVGEGADSFRTAGADFRATYLGTLKR